LPVTVCTYEPNEADISQCAVHFQHFDGRLTKWHAYLQRQAGRQHQQQLVPESLTNLEDRQAGTDEAQQQHNSTGSHILEQQQQQQQQQHHATSTATATAAATTTTSSTDEVMGSVGVGLSIGGTIMPSKNATTATAMKDIGSCSVESSITAVGGGAVAVKELRRASSSATSMSSSVHTSATTSGTSVGNISSSIVGDKIGSNAALVNDNVSTATVAVSTAVRSSGNSSTVARSRKSRWGQTTKSAASNNNSSDGDTAKQQQYARTIGETVSTDAVTGTGSSVCAQMMPAMLLWLAKS
jgi:hypothetical protein